jgi:formylglycine-generating enzyme
MVLIPGGTFLMGRNDGPAAERPAHQVTLSPYYIDQHEVTIRQYAIFQQDPQRKAESRPGTSGHEGPESDDFPVTQVTAREARAYNQWAGKDLPTEAQWEMAARTTDGRLHPWGNDPPVWGDDQDPNKHPEPRKLYPVMSFPTTDISPYGVFDMATNASEWTNDLFDPRYYEQFKNTTATNPQGPPRSNNRKQQVVIKGGSPKWDIPWREGRPVETRSPNLGFRGVLTLDRSGGAPPPTPGTSPTSSGNGSVPF